MQKEELLKSLLESDFTKAQVDAVETVFDVFPKLISVSITDIDTGGFEFTSQNYPLAAIALKNSMNGVDENYLTSMFTFMKHFLISNIEHTRFHFGNLDKPFSDEVLTNNNVIDLMLGAVQRELNDASMKHFISLASLDNVGEYLASNNVDDCFRDGVKNVYHPCASHPHPVFKHIESIKSNSAKPDLTDQEISKFFKNAAKA
jgi:hypothetical protein